MIGRILIALALLAVPASAHDGVKHETAEEAAAHLRAKPLPEDDGGTLPFALPIGGDYELVDHNGETRTQVDPDGGLQLVFFGYAKCQAICTVALPRMAEMAEVTAEAGIAVQPLLITVDPERDTPEAMKEELNQRHPNVLGLTGDEDALAVARKAFQVERKLVYEDPEYGPIYAHGSHIYLMDANGKLLTLIPPILGPDRGAEIIAKYAAVSG
ncbi:MAG: SCO family protein [Pseudomonadota bacterium]